MLRRLSSLRYSDVLRMRYVGGITRGSDENSLALPVAKVDQAGGVFLM